MNIRRMSYPAHGFESVSIWAATEDDAAWSVMEFQAEHPISEFGPVVLSVTGCWIAHGRSDLG